MKERNLNLFPVLGAKIMLRPWQLKLYQWYIVRSYYSMKKETLTLSVPLGQKSKNIFDKALPINLHIALFVPCRKFESPYLGKTQQLQEQHYPFLSVCAVFLCVQTMLWLPVSGIFNVHTDINECDGTQGVNRHHLRVCNES